MASKTATTDVPVAQSIMQFTLEPKNVHGKYDDYFKQFQAILSEKFDLEELISDVLNKGQITNQISKQKARSLFWDNFKDVYLPQEDIASLVEQTAKNYIKIYFDYLPNIYRAKYIGELKEAERMSLVDQKPDQTQWEFKLGSLKEHYQIKVVNFEGKANMLLEQIFEILNSNYTSIVSLLKVNRTLEASTQILTFAKYFLGGNNLDYYPTIAVSVIDQTCNGFLDFFFGRFMPMNLNFFSKQWSETHRAVSKAVQDYPDAHLFLNTFRLAMVIPEVRMYCMRTVEALGELLVNSKLDKRVLGSVGKIKERQLLRSNLTPKIILSKETIEEIFRLLDLRLLASCFSYNSSIAILFDKLLQKARHHVQQKDLDYNNVFLIILFIQLYGLLIFYECQVCRTLCKEEELQNQYLFLNDTMINIPYDVDYLESTVPTLAFHLAVLEALGSLIPALIYHMGDTKEKADWLVSVLQNYGQHIDLMIEPIESPSILEPISPFADRLMLIPLDRLKNFMDLLFKTPSIVSLSSTSYPTTFALLEVLIESLKQLKSAYHKKIQEYLQQDLSPHMKHLVFLTSNITSLYNEEQLAEGSQEVFKFFNIKGNYLEKYAASLEKVTYQIAQSASFNGQQAHTDSYLPLLLNKTRSVSPFLVNLVQLDSENKELLERMLDNCTLYMLWRLLSPIDFESTFAKEVDAMVFNTQYLKPRIDRLMRLKRIGKLLLDSFRQSEREELKYSNFLYFTEEAYLKGFFQASN